MHCRDVIWVQSLYTCFYSIFFLVWIILLRHMWRFRPNQKKNGILKSNTTHFSSWQLLLNACNQFTTILMTIGTIDYWFLIRLILGFYSIAFTRFYCCNLCVTFNFIGINHKLTSHTRTHTHMRCGSIERGFCAHIWLHVEVYKKNTTN